MSLLRFRHSLNHYGRSSCFHHGLQTTKPRRPRQKPLHHQNFVVATSHSIFNLNLFHRAPNPPPHGAPPLPSLQSQLPSKLSHHSDYKVSTLIHQALTAKHQFVPKCLSSLTTAPKSFIASRCQVSPAFSRRGTSPKAMLHHTFIFASHGRHHQSQTCSPSCVLPNPRVPVSGVLSAPPCLQLAPTMSPIPEMPLTTSWVLVSGDTSYTPHI